MLASCSLQPENRMDLAPLERVPGRHVQQGVPHHQPLLLLLPPQLLQRRCVTVQRAEAQDRAGGALRRAVVRRAVLWLAALRRAVLRRAVVQWAAALNIALDIQRFAVRRASTEARAGDAVVDQGAQQVGEPREADLRDVIEDGGGTLLTLRRRFGVGRRARSPPPAEK